MVFKDFQKDVKDDLPDICRIICHVCFFLQREL